MPLPVPQLDDRRFQDIVDEAKQRLRTLAPAWTDHNVSDPGITLIELFAWMTDIIIYRLNRVPEKQYIAFLQLLGIELEPPRPAQAQISFSLTRPWKATDQRTLVVPVGTEVSSMPTEAQPNRGVVFQIEHPTYVTHPGPPQVYRKRANETRITVCQNNSEILMFGNGQDEPARDDCLYLGFKAPIAGYTLRLHFEFGATKPSQFNQIEPPITWQAWDTYRTWATMRTANDTTGGLINDGSIDLHVPLDLPDAFDVPFELVGTGADKLYYICCRYTPTDQTAGAKQNIYKPAPTIKQLEVSVAGVTAVASHAERVLDELLGVSDGQPSQRFKLAYQPVLALLPGESVEVETGAGTNSWEAWVCTNDFSASQDSDRHVQIDYVAGEVCFGPSIRQLNGPPRQYGKIPPAGARVRLNQYRYNPSAEIGVLPAGALTVLKRTLPYVQPITHNHTPTTRGHGPEAIEHAALRVRRLLRHGERAVTRQDFERLATHTTPLVARAHCLDPVPGERMVKILILQQTDQYDTKPIPVADLVPSQGLIEAVQQELDKRRMLTTRVEVQQPSLVEVAVTVRMRILPQFRAAHIREEAQRRLYRFLNPLIGGSLAGPAGGWEFGRTLYPSEVLVLLQSIPGVELIYWLNFAPSIWQAKPGARYPTCDKGADTQEQINLQPDQVIISGQHTIEIDGE